MRVYEKKEYQKLNKMQKKRGKKKNIEFCIIGFTKEQLQRIFCVLIEIRKNWKYVERKVINMKKLIKLRKGQYDAYIDDVQEETICDIEYLVLVVMIRVYGKQDDFTDVPIKKYFKSANGENMKLIDFLESAGALLETGEVDLEQLYKYWMTAEVYESEKGTMKIGELEVGEEIEYEE